MSGDHDGATPELSSLLRLPARADARRSYLALLEAATEVFADQGPDASLDAIARRAGTGNATLYRHFPTRHDLLVAVCVGEVEALHKHGEDLLASASPAEALVTWMHAFVDHISAQQGLAAALLKGRAEGSTVVDACMAAIAAQADTLLSAAQQAGSIRAELQVEDVLAIANAVALVDGIADSGARGRLLRFFVEGVAT